MKHLAYLASIFFIWISSSPLLHAAEDKAALIKEGQLHTKRCTSCHGSGGASKIDTNPILAGQQFDYLVNQLKAFKSGKRHSSIMNSLSARLNKNSIISISAYFSSLPHTSAGGNAELAAEGKKKAARCLGCHGSKAQGRGNFPKLAGQHPHYLEKQLHAFKSGHREGGPMGAVAKTLSEQDIKEITAYFGTL